MITVTVERRSPGLRAGALEVLLPRLDRQRPMPDPAAAREKLKLLRLSCGNKDGLIRISRGVHTFLKEKDIPHVWNVDGHAHDLTEWRNNLYHFMQRLFR